MDADQLRFLSDGTSSIVPEDGLAAKLALGRPLRVKLGLDPTAPAVTLGWAVVLRRLRRFQDLGHQAVLIIGDLTARVGDPSGKTDTRPRLTKEEVDAYSEPLLEQFGTVLDMDRVELRRNSEWLEPMGMEEILALTSSTTVARMLERDDFAQRFAAARPISLMELLYPLLQGRDSVAVEADVEMGGSDQLFNLLVGRDLQRQAGQDPQVALTMPLLEGLDGVQKMSQSLGNYVGVAEPPDDQFGKLMRIPDALIVKFLRLCTNLAPSEVDDVEVALARGTVGPNEAKRRMAREVVDLYHGAGSGTAAEARFERVHRAHEAPEETPVRSLGSELFRPGEGDSAVVHVPALLEALGMVESRSEARRLIAQGGVRRDGEQVLDQDIVVAGDAPPGDLAGSLWQVGRRRFVRVADALAGTGSEPTDGPPSS